MDIQRLRNLNRFCHKTRELGTPFLSTSTITSHGLQKYIIPYHRFTRTMHSLIPIKMVKKYNHRLSPILWTYSNIKSSQELDDRMSETTKMIVLDPLIQETNRNNEYAESGG